MAERILFPAGRMIGGSVEKLYPVMEQDGKTPKIGRDQKPMMSISFGVAIPKMGEQHWNQTQWGAAMWNIGRAGAPQMHMAQSFAWKVIDGDSTAPNKNGKIPNTLTGYAGHWVIWFKQGWAPKLVNADGSVELPAGSIVPGYYVQVAADVAFNGAVPPNTLGLYLNPVAVALVGIGEKIATDVDTTSMGFGQAALPPGAQPVPPAFDMNGPAPVAGSTTAPPPIPPASTAAPVTPATPVTPVAPNAAYMAPPPPPTPPAAPTAQVVPQMTAKANGASYEQFKNGGWTDEMMRQQGYLV